MYVCMYIVKQYDQNIIKTKLVKIHSKNECMNEQMNETINEIKTNKKKIQKYMSQLAIKMDLIIK